MTANDNPQWWQVHIPGQVVEYGHWLISYNPPPIPARCWDWQWAHKDFDGDDGACDDRHGASSSLADAIGDIDDFVDEHWEESPCAKCSVAAPWQCEAIGPCGYRDDYNAREQVRDLMAKVQA